MTTPAPQKFVFVVSSSFTDPKTRATHFDIRGVYMALQDAQARAAGRNWTVTKKELLPPATEAP